MNRQPYYIQPAVTPTPTSCKHHIHISLFDLYHTLEIITLGNYNGPDAGPQPLMGSYIYRWLTITIQHTSYAYLW